MLAGLLAAALVGLDLSTKQWMAGTFARGESRTIIPGFFDLMLIHNTGAAFGLGRTWGMNFFLVTSAAAIGVVIYLFSKLAEEEVLSRIALTLILAGAIGNLVDRVRLGYVVDFFYFHIGRHYWPAFNIADSCITVGAILFAIDLMKKKSEAAHTKGS